MNASRPASPDPRIVREDDPEHDRLIARGRRIVSRSWGARPTLAARLGDGTWLAFGALGFELEPAWHAPAPPPPA